MTLLVFHYAKMWNSPSQKHGLNWELHQVKQKAFALTDYSQKISDGSVSVSDLMSANPSMFNRMSMYMMYSHQAALAGAQEKFGFMAQTQGAMPQLPNAQMQQQYQMMMFKNLYEQEREKFKKQETKVLDQQNEQLDAKANQIEQELSMLSAEMESVKKAEKMKQSKIQLQNS